MRHSAITKTEANHISELTEHFEQNRYLFDRFVKQLIPLFSDSKELSSLIHSMKWRVKEPSHLKEKLERKTLDAKEKGKKLSVTKENLFYTINDLAGFRLIHLHTRQMEAINAALTKLFEEEFLSLVEGPIARTWDDESRDYFKSIGIRTVSSPGGSMYTSVHYVIQPNRKTRYTCEIQVRTLSEEIWGEVSHKINYPGPTDSVACAEQLKVLARVASSCSRLVDSIFASEADHHQKKILPKKAS